MIRSVILALSALTVVATPARAAVVGQSPHGFEIRHEVIVPLAPAQAWSRIIAIGDWWSDDHTFSGKAANMSIEPKAGGCFCETLPNAGGVEHLRVNYIVPGQRLVMGGPLGPLKFEGVAGIMDIRIGPAPQGRTNVVMIYRAGGFARGNGQDMAPLVDRVLGEQVARLATLPATP
jgi:hypothetical protein